MKLNSFVQKLSAVALMALLIAPLGQLLAADSTGEITINVIDEEGKPMVGNWRLHQGPNSAGILRRNGSSGENFKFDEGVFYLIANGVPTHRYTVITSKNPQALTAGSEITYTAQYFKTEEARDKARKVLQDAAKKEVEVKTNTTSTNTTKEAEKKEVTPVAKEVISDAELAKIKADKLKQQQEELAMRQKAAQLAKEKAGTGNVANAAQRKAAEVKAAAEAEAQAKVEAEKKAETTAKAKADAEAQAKVEAIKKRAAAKAKAAEIRAAAEKRAAEAAATSANEKLTKAPQLAATGTPLIGLLIPSLVGGFVFRKRK